VEKATNKLLQQQKMHLSFKIKKKKGGTFRKMPPGISSRVDRPGYITIYEKKQCFMALKQY
jgi:hypothetical protein